MREYVYRAPNDYVPAVKSNPSRLVRHSSIVPENVTGRSVPQIVAEAEASWLAPLLVQTSELAHFEDCRCYTCVQAKLDEFVRRSESLVTKTIETEAA